jgi:hypothetical protein
VRELGAVTSVPVMIAIDRSSAAAQEEEQALLLLLLL